MRIGVLTGGGDCPGLNAVIRAVVRKAINDHGDTVVGFMDAWDGVLEKRTMELTVAALAGMLPRGGTILGTRRGSPFDYPDGPQRVKENLRELAVDALIVIGGNGSLWVASKLHNEVGLNVIGVPKTIDNDIEGTDVCFGFNTAVQIALAGLQHTPGLLVVPLQFSSLNAPSISITSLTPSSASTLADDTHQSW